MQSKETSLTFIFAIHIKFYLTAIKHAFVKIRYVQGITKRIVC